MEDKTAGEEAPIHIPHHISLQKIAVFLILALVLTAGIAFAVKNLINKEVSPSEIISGSKIPTLAPNTNVTTEPTVPASTDTTNWKTFTNTQYGYSIKYPSGIAVKTISGPSETIIFSFPAIQKWTAELTVERFDNPSGLTGKEFSQERYQKFEQEAQAGNGPPPQKPLSTREIKIGDENAFQEEYFAFDGNKRVTYLSREKQIIAIDFYSENKNDPLNEKHVQIFDQILSTFKFTDLNQTKFTCPQNGWVNCMPILVTEEAKLACSSEAVEWYKTNCPNFEGVAQ